MKNCLKIRVLVMLVVVLVSQGQLQAQLEMMHPNPDLLTSIWDARWIVPRNTDVKNYGVFHYRKSFEIKELPDKFIVSVSADNRYKLYVNGTYVCNGPARGDLAHWRFETVDIAPLLQPGKNVLAAVVWNFGIYAPKAQITERTAFILQGNSDAEKIVNTNESWLIYKNPSYTALPFGPAFNGFYTVKGPGDQVDANVYPWGWEQVDYDDSQWLSPDDQYGRHVRLPGRPAGTHAGTYWQFVPREIPAMEYKKQRFHSIRSDGGICIKPSFLNGESTLKIPSNSTISVLIDQGVLTTAYPELVVSEGKNSSIKITYAEAMFDENRNKGNRNELEGKHIEGDYDVFISDGKTRTFQPLWFRTFRYVQLDITTKDEALILRDFYSYFTAYPLIEKATFASDNKSLDDIWETGWRTARLCANETYVDCPYYEQLNYIGDTRIQALISYYISGDNRLAKNAINQFFHSQTPEGMVECRYPASLELIITDYSILWIGLIHDYWMHYDDPKFVKQFLIPIAKVLDWFEVKVNEQGMLDSLPYWTYIDSRYYFDIRNAKANVEKNNAVNTLFYIYGLQMAADMNEYFGLTYEAKRYRQRANELKTNVYALCYNNDRKLLAETSEQLMYSQHANILGVLTDAIPLADQKSVIERILLDQTLISCNYYFTFYLARSLNKVELGDKYLDLMQPWYDMLDIGLTTFREAIRGVRSDCHAWSSSPMYDFFATICGITPAEPGFKKVRIQPYLGKLNEVSAKMPHPYGEIQVDFKRKGDSGITGKIVLPQGLTGEFKWRDKVTVLHSGTQNIEL